MKTKVRLWAVVDEKGEIQRYAKTEEEVALNQRGQMMVYAFEEMAQYQAHAMEDCSCVALEGVFRGRKR